MLFALAGAVVLSVIVGGDLRDRTLIGVLPSLTYTMNWYRSVGHEYGLITHLWSLCVEEQFYLVWPAVMLLCLRRGPRAAFYTASVVALACAGLTSLLYALGGADRVYYGSDARAPELLVGAAAGLAYFIWRPTRQARHLLFVGAVSGAVAIVWAAHGPVPAGLWNNGGYGLFALPVACLIVHLVDTPTRIFSAVLAWEPSVAIGRLSYAMYLWHYPLTITIRHYKPSMRPSVLFVFVTLITLAISFISYRLVELRFLRLKNRLAALT